MKLEDQVCSLELSRKLKELGVKQEALFFWVDDLDDSWVVYIGKYQGAINKSGIDAFTVSELGKMLPSFVHNFRNHTKPNQWTCNYDEAHEVGDTEADVRAKMLIYLLENKIK